MLIIITNRQFVHSDWQSDAEKAIKCFFNTYFLWGIYIQICSGLWEVNVQAPSRGKFLSTILGLTIPSTVRYEFVRTFFQTSNIKIKLLKTLRTLKFLFMDKYKKFLIFAFWKIFARILVAQTEDWGFQLIYIMWCE